MKVVKELIIEAGKAKKNYWSDIYRFRELFFILSWRDLKVRYKQTVIGVLWSIIRPLLTMVVFTVVFRKFANLPSDGTAPYAVLVYAAILPWHFFSNALTESSGSLIGNANLISKVYFPRMIIPASAVITSLVDFAISFVILIALIIGYHYTPDLKILLLPFFLILCFFSAFGIGLYLTALNVKYRDFRYIIPFIVQFGLYISPVGFSSNVIPEKWKLLYCLNPMVGIIDGFRWCILGETDLYIPSVILSISITILLLILGVWYFRKMEKSFADNI